MAQASPKRRRSYFYGGKLTAVLSVSLEDVCEAAVVVTWLSVRGACRRKKAMAWCRGKCASRPADAANVEATREAQTVSVDARNASYQEHVDRLYGLAQRTGGPQERLVSARLLAPVGRTDARRFFRRQWRAYVLGG